jgi:hypothetical protein
MSDDLVKRLDNCWAMLEDEGFYTKANTVMLAKQRLEKLEAGLKKLVSTNEILLEQWDRCDSATFRQSMEVLRTDLLELKGETDE